MAHFIATFHRLDLQARNLHHRCPSSSRWRHHQVDDTAPDALASTHIYGLASKVFWPNERVPRGTPT